MATAYLDLAAFRLRTLMPQIDINTVEAETPGFTAARLATWSAKIDTRLRKRYAVPFAVPVPEAVLEWLTKIVTFELYLKRGVDPADQSIALVKADKEQAEAEVKEAADAVGGLFDLPLLDTKDATAITKGAPLAYVETSPYVAFDLQRTNGRADDNSGSGTS
jgi:hypothetical protein